MLPLRFARHWRVASLVLLLLVLAATLSPVIWPWPGARQLVSWIANADKWAHGSTFALLSVWFAGQYHRRVYWRIGIGLILFGMLIEGCQRFVAYRSADWFDIVANTAGVSIGLALALAGLGGWSLRLEDWYATGKASGD